MLLEPLSSGACGDVQTCPVVLLSFASIGNARDATLHNVIWLVEEMSWSVEGRADHGIITRGVTRENPSKCLMAGWMTQRTLDAGMALCAGVRQKTKIGDILILVLIGGAGSGFELLKPN